MRVTSIATTALAASTYLALATGCDSATAERASSARTAGSKVEPKADALLRMMAKGLSATKFQVDADHVLEVVTKEGEVLQFVAQSRVGVQRPDHVRSDRLGPVADATLYYDGDRVTIYGKRANLYASAAAPSSIDGALDFARDELGLEAPAGDLLYSDVYDGLMTGVTSGRYVGLEPVGDRSCHHLAYRGEETDWQIWIEDSAMALPCRYVIRSKKMTGTPTFQVSLSSWNLSPSFEDSHFTFVPPKNATQIDFLTLEAHKESKQRRVQ